MSDLSMPGLDVWPTERLGELCDILIGRTPSRNRPELWNGEHPWLSIADMNQGRRIRTTKEKITTLGVSESGSRLIPTGTVLLSFKLSIGKVAVADIDTYTNEAIAALPILNPKKLSRGYLFWTLRSIRLDEEVDVAAKGKTLNKAKLERLEIPLPPLDEQKRIAAVLDKADALRRQRQNSLKLTEKLLQSVFIDMFGDPKTNSNNWEVVPLGNLVADGDTINYGVVQPGADFTNGVPLIRLGNLAVPDPLMADVKRIDPQIDSSYERSRLIGGEVLIGCVGHTIGVSCIAPIEWAGANVARAVARVNLKPGIAPEFILQQIRTPAIQHYFRGERRIVGQPTLNIKQIKEAPILLPPPEHRDRFALFYRATLDGHTNKQIGESLVERLFLVIQQRAFRGELDLSRLVLDLSDDTPAATAPAKPTTKPSKPNASACFFQAPAAIDTSLKKFDAVVKKGETIPWSEDYFKYRILSDQPFPFSFSDLMQNAAAVFEEPPPYETIRDLIFDLLGQDGKPALLRQRFDIQTHEETNEVTSRKEIIFESMP